jgi:hypothetical protein
MKHPQGNIPNQGLNFSIGLDPFQISSVLFPIEREFLSSDWLLWNHPEHSQSPRSIDT